MNYQFGTPWQNNQLGFNRRRNGIGGMNLPNDMMRQPQPSPIMSMGAQLGGAPPGTGGMMLPPAMGGAPSGTGGPMLPPRPETPPVGWPMPQAPSGTGGFMPQPMPQAPSGTGGFMPQPMPQTPSGTGGPMLPPLQQMPAPPMSMNGQPMPDQLPQDMLIPNTGAKRLKPLPAPLQLNT